MRRKASFGGATDSKQQIRLGVRGVRWRQQARFGDGEFVCRTRCRHYKNRRRYATLMQAVRRVHWQNFRFTHGDSQASVPRRGPLQLSPIYPVAAFVSGIMF